MCYHFIRALYTKHTYDIDKRFLFCFVFLINILISKAKRHGYLVLEAIYLQIIIIIEDLVRIHSRISEVVHLNEFIIYIVCIMKRYKLNIIS